MNPFRKIIPGAPLLAIAMAPALHAATVTFDQVSSPAGIVIQSNPVESATSVSTTTAPVNSGNFRFTHWKIQGIRQQDITGRATNPSRFTIFENSTATAYYLPFTEDADADGVPDWFEIEFYATLANNASSDTDGDGATLLEEYTRDHHPSLREETRDGGISRATSAKLQVSFGPGYFHYRESSQPAGFVIRDEIFPSGSVVTSTSGSFSGFSFGYFTVDGVRKQDATGRALNQISTTVTQDTNVVGYYLSTTADVDSDGVPDWYEQLYFGTLDRTANDDADNDGIPLGTEYQQDLHPGMANVTRDGGISRASSATASYNVSNLLRYTIASNPTGFLTADTTLAAAGTTVSSPLISSAPNGYTFTHWLVNGVRHADSMGNALHQATVTLQADTTFEANYISTTQDSDGDGVPDWFELRYYGNLNQDPASDSDGDGVTLLAEYQRDSLPTLATQTRAGGISRASSARATVNLQPFERLRFAKRNAVLGEFFTFDSNIQPLSGMDFGNDASPVYCDWDADGDPDLMIASSDGLTVFENTGSRYDVNYVNRSNSFGNMASFMLSKGKVTLAVGDWTQDGAEDLIVGDSAGAVYLFSSSRHFGATQPSAPARMVNVGGTSVLPALGDLNGDGRVDLIALKEDGSVSKWLHSGSLSAPYSGAPSENILAENIPNATGLSIADINEDGRNDILVSDNDGRIWEFHAATTGESYAIRSKVWAGAGSGFASGLRICVRDMDGDGDFDLLGGTTNGALIALRDPRVGRPAGLVAYSGANSTLLEWDPDWQSRIKGYHVYREGSLTGPWSRLTAAPHPSVEYLDSNVTRGLLYYYRVSGVTEAFYPGNTNATLIEGPPSSIVSASPGVVSISIRPARALPGKVAKIAISLDNSIGLSGTGMDLRFGYDPTKLKPLAQVDSSKETVRLSGLSKKMTIMDNGAIADGELRVQGLSGEMENGQGKFMTLNFMVLPGADVGQKVSLTLLSASFQSSGQPVTIVVREQGTITIDGTYISGDVTGDGEIDDADKDLLKELIKPKARTATQEELVAGDLNGNGKLDANDVTLLIRLINELEP